MNRIKRMDPLRLTRPDGKPIVFFEGFTIQPSHEKIAKGNTIIGYAGRHHAVQEDFETVMAAIKKGSGLL